MRSTALQAKYVFPCVIIFADHDFVWTICPQ